MQNFFITPVALAIALLCSGCIVIPVPVPIPIASEGNSATALPFRKQFTTKLDEKYRNTCYADSVPESESSAITEDSGKLETAGDRLVAAGKYKQAIRKYNEASAAALNESIADGSALEMEIDTLLYSKEEIEEFREKHRLLIQKSAESNFKIGSSYAKIGKYKNAIDCFSGTLKIGILPPNDAIAYLNRGDAYEKMGDKAKARTDFWQAVILFKKYKREAYQKISEQRLQKVQ